MSALRNGGTGVVPTKKKKKNDAPQGIKGAFSAVFDALSFFMKNNYFKKSAPFFCGITRDYCL